MGRRTITLKKSIAALSLLFLAAIIARFGSDERIPWIDAAVWVHAQSGGINCGSVVDNAGQTEMPWKAKQALGCISSALKEKRPFRVIFTFGIGDGEFSNAIVGDAQGKAVELLYGTGAVVNAGALLKHQCAQPLQLQIATSTSFHKIPVPHCLPSPDSSSWQKDHLFW
jgi:hypothetical protein